MVGLAGCQTLSTVHPAPVYSGYFVWDSDRPLGDLALQCMRMVFDGEEVLADGRRRLTGVTRYVTGSDDEINFVKAELIYDPRSGAFEMWETEATSEDFVGDGKFEGRFLANALLLEGAWASDRDGKTGRLSMRRGADAPCFLADDA
jgi:hypothetical protein